MFKKVNRYQCPDCKYETERPRKICPECGYGLPKNKRRATWNTYRGYSQAVYYDGHKRPTEKAIDRNIKTGKWENRDLWLEIGLVS